MASRPTPSHFLGGASHAERGQGAQLVLQFLIVGSSAAAASDESTKAAPSLLYQYPAGQPIVNASLPFFCFPEGVRIKKLRRTKSNSRLHAVRFSSLKTLEDPQHSFTFLLTGENEAIYGVCVQSEELLDELPSVCAPSDPAGPRARAGSALPAVGFSASALRCYCLVSRFPFFKLHFDFLYTLLAKDRHVRQAGGAAAEVEQLIHGYSQVAVPQHGTALTFKLPGDVHEFNFVLPGHDQDSILTEWCAPLLFSLSVDTTVTLVAALLQEYRVVVQSQRLGVVTRFVLGLVPLLKPLVWQGSLVPILPEQMWEAVEAPTPYIFGVRSFVDLNHAVDEKEMVLVDVDSATIRVPDGMARLPREDSLRRALQLGFLDPQKHKPPLECMASVQAHVREELKRIHEMVTEVCAKFAATETAAVQAAAMLSAASIPAAAAAGSSTLSSSPSVPRTVVSLDWEAQEQVNAVVGLAKSEKKRAFYRRLFASQLWLSYVGAQVSERERAELAEREATQKVHQMQRDAQRRKAESAVSSRFEQMITAEQAVVKELEGLIQDNQRKLLAARDRLEALQLVAAGRRK